MAVKELEAPAQTAANLKGTQKAAAVPGAIAEQRAAQKQNPEDARYRQALQRQQGDLDAILLQLREGPGR